MRFILPWGRSFRLGRKPEPYAQDAETGLFYMVDGRPPFTDLAALGEPSNKAWVLGVCHPKGGEFGTPPAVIQWVTEWEGRDSQYLPEDCVVTYEDARKVMLWNLKLGRERRARQESLDAIASYPVA